MIETTAVPPGLKGQIAAQLIVDAEHRFMLAVGFQAGSDSFCPALICIFEETSPAGVEPPAKLACASAVRRCNNVLRC
jgi:hypothetical protein